MHTKGRLFVSFSILILGLSGFSPAYAYQQESSIDVVSNRVNNSSKLLHDTKNPHQYSLSKYDKTIEEMIKEDFDKGNENFKSGRYQLALNNYNQAIDGLKIMYRSNASYHPQERQLIISNLISSYENRSLTHLKLYSAYSTYHKDLALKDLGEVVKYYGELGDRVRAFETVQEIRRIGGNEEANKYTY
jgi:tetratricopeptide (TPR) repeat protein